MKGCDIMPTPRTGVEAETRAQFLSRCFSDEEARVTFKDTDQRYAFCVSQWENRNDEKDS